MTKHKHSAFIVIYTNKAVQLKLCRNAWKSNNETDLNISHLYKSNLKDRLPDNLSFTDYQKIKK